VTVWRSSIQRCLIELPKGARATGVVVGEDELVGDIVNDLERNNQLRILMVQRELIIEVSHPYLRPLFFQ
jgi:hypothetical protein